VLCGDDGRIAVADFGLAVVATPAGDGDDLDGTEATETVSFGIDGTTYEIDLNDANAASLREALSGYVGHARKVTGGGRRTRRSSGGSSSSSSSSNTKDVREWAKSQGMEVSERGRISADVQQAYDAAH
jgi:hypothetical protein